MEIKNSKNRLEKQQWNYHDKTWTNRILKLFIGCIAALIISYLFNYKNFDESNIVLPVLFGIAMWIILMIQKKI
ncbi:cell division protein FtsW (lipid II flippase) [Flavobacterium nitrogenifigens]|uniref:Cell division protein FtsW (Lipid II flippase) n=2 Tax=Flavobacterium TaxID=237 RepID=A0A7W7IYS2_9FLAO|nr:MULTISPECIES: hypothetical protein [Flavobacterium]MBB4803064.1 cell division protein FtsW (lipid II flippase) [Flavobacterium nitrogenifigens]MBB6388022.1 cell division protein FtsW (lipid II flippase) [Flavobacterium notoginsengisoli]